MEVFQEARNGNVPQFAASDQVKKMLLLDPEQRPEARLIILGNGLLFEIKNYVQDNI